MDSVAQVISYRTCPLVVDKVPEKKMTFYDLWAQFYYIQVITVYYALNSISCLLMYTPFQRPFDQTSNLYFLHYVFLLKVYTIHRVSLTGQRRTHSTHTAVVHRLTKTYLHILARLYDPLP